MKTTASTMLWGAAALVGWAFAGVASAQGTWSDPIKWDFGVPCNTPSCTAGGVQLTVSGFGSSGGNYVGGTVTNQGTSPDFGVGLGFRSANTWGNETTSSPNHAFDNRGTTSNPGSGTNHGTTNEVLLLDFGSAKINLTAIQTGWSSNDTDVMVFRWDKVEAPTLTSTAGPSGLLTAGWSLVSAKDLDGTDSTSFTNSTVRTFDLSTGVGYSVPNSADKLSSWWLVSTYFAGAGVSGNKLDTSTSDYFKLLSFTGKLYSAPPDNNRTPEPGTLALAAAAFLGSWGASRRRKRVPPLS